MDFSFVFIFLLVLIPFWFIYKQPAMNCPNCNKRLPTIGAPWRKTRRQWVKGGYVCDSCQMEVDITGNAIPADAPSISTMAVIRAITPTVLVPVVAIVASYFLLSWGMDQIKQRATAAEVQAAEVLPAKRETITRHKAPQAFVQSREAEVHARLVLHEHGLVHGVDLYSFGVELENVPFRTGGWVEFDLQDIQLNVADEHGKIVSHAPTERSGPVIPPRTALIPPSGYTVFSTHDPAVMSPGLKRFNAGNEAWHLKPGQYQVTASVLIRLSYESTGRKDRPVFSADLPKVELNIAATTLIVSR